MHGIENVGENQWLGKKQNIEVAWAGVAPELPFIRYV
jgi:hypothetical protein